MSEMQFNPPAPVDGIEMRCALLDQTDGIEVSDLPNSPIGLAAKNVRHVFPGGRAKHFLHSENRVFDNRHSGFDCALE